MRLLDTYALYCGAKIDKPYIYESFFPVSQEKYITFQAQTPYDSRNYAYWQDVIDMILPIVGQHGYTIVQLGKSDEIPYQRVVNLLGQTNYHQLAYIVHRAALHFGPDSFGVHLAAHFDKPIVALYSISMPEVAGPHFGNKEKHILFKGYQRVGNGKPSYSPNENPKSVNSIKPEEVANAIFKLLDIQAEVPFETVFLGNKYSHAIVREVIPNSGHVLPMPDQPVEIRYDLFSDEQLLIHHLNYWQKAVIVTDKPINFDLLKHFKPRIATLVYEITPSDNPEFVKNVSQIGIPLALITRLDETSLQQRKIHYYEYGTINKLAEPPEDVISKLRKDIDNLYYRSSKVISSNGHLFGSHADVAANKPIQADFEYRRVTDSLLFWKDLDFCTIVKKK